MFKYGPCDPDFDDVFTRRVTRIGLDAERLKPDHAALFADIASSCPGCEDPARCAAELAAPKPGSNLEDWDDYCPNAPRLRVLAALTMFADKT